MADIEQFIPFKNYLEQAIDELEEDGGGGGGLGTGDNILNAATTIRVTDGALSLEADNAANGVLTLSGELGTTIGTTSAAGSAFVVYVDGGNDKIQWVPGDFNLKIDDAGVDSQFRVKTDQITLRAGGDDSSINIDASVGNGTQSNIGLNATNILFTSDAIGFFGVGLTPRPVVPLTSPTVQDVIDALVSLGLIAQSD